MNPQAIIHALEARSVKLLVSRGYEPVRPVSGSIFWWRVPLNFVGMKGDTQALCVKLRIAHGSVSEEYVETNYPYDICRFRSLLLQALGDISPQCEIWVLSPNNALHCFEVLSTTIREVAAYTR